MAKKNSIKKFRTALAFSKQFFIGLAVEGVFRWEIWIVE